MSKIDTKITVAGHGHRIVSLEPVPHVPGENYYPSFLLTVEKQSRDGVHVNSEIVIPADAMEKVARMLVAFWGCE